MYYVALAVPLGLVSSLGLAMLLHQRLRGIGVFRTIFFLPSITNMVAVSVLWLWIFNPEYGLLNIVLQKFGIIGPLWLQSEEWAKPALIVMSLWGTGGTMIIFLAALQGIPRELFEAASLDGAGSVRRFFHITLPMISPAFFFNLISRCYREFPGVYAGLRNDGYSAARERRRTEQRDVVRGPVPVQEGISGIQNGVCFCPCLGALCHYPSVYGSSNGVCRNGGSITRRESDDAARSAQDSLITIGPEICPVWTLSVLSVAFILPFAWMFSVSLHDLHDVFLQPFRGCLPCFAGRTIDRAIELFPFWRSLGNTVLLSVSVVIV